MLALLRICRLLHLLRQYNEMFPGGRVNLTWGNFMVYALMERKFLEDWRDSIIRWICYLYVLPSSRKSIDRATRQFDLFERYMKRAEMFGYVTIEPDDPAIAKKWWHVAITPAGYEFMEPTGFIKEALKKYGIVGSFLMGLVTTRLIPLLGTLFEWIVDVWPAL